MPRLRRLSGAEVIRILKQFGFEVIRVRGSHHILRRVVGEETQTVNVPVHANKVLASGLLKRLYRDLSRYISEDELYPHFYAGD
jgi:predicted RNA binding protein YcfA (HicA-like mRNA interferase family)